MKNYYFKFQIANRGFGIWLEQDKKSNVVPLSIYYGRWKAAELSDGLAQRTTTSAKKQIETFYDLQKEKDVYFWIFYQGKVYCFKGVNLKVFDGPDKYIYPDGDLPKSVEAELFCTYEKINLPEFFSNINANQHYNRGTICKLYGSAEKFASALISGNKLNINAGNFYEYLSPTEFETLIFLIFNSNGNLCSSFRGGTLKDYDLRVRLFNDFKGMPSGVHWIQVKLKSKEELKIKGYLISLHDKTNLAEKTIGIDWIKDRIKESTHIQNWLKEMIFNYDNINFDL